jgi:hypothetical protein
MCEPSLVLVLEGDVLDEPLLEEEEGLSLGKGNWLTARGL